MARVLLVDDEANMRRILSVILREDRHTVMESPGLRGARDILAATPLDLVITDQKMPDGEGLEVLAACREADPLLPVILLTAHATLELAVQAMRQGAFDVLSKPFVPEAVRAVVQRACRQADLQRENARLKEEVLRLAVDQELLGSSPVLQTVRQTLARVAVTNATVLVTGETGTGKELAARAIHRGSPRAGKPFVAINCAALPETLLDSELFGHERGAFTGADRARAGLFETADGGTLFLDEAGEMPMPLQAKLLRVLTDGQILRVGSRQPRSVDVRLIVATHRDLKQRVKDGLFREDLYYRIAVVPVVMPALRDRAEDIPLLAWHFLDQAARDMNLPGRSISDAALQRLVAYPFPGNIRELRNLIERACILAGGALIEPDDLPLEGHAAPSASAGLDAFIRSLPPNMELRQLLEEIEKTLIQRALAAAGGVQAEAARQLGLSRSDLGYRLKKYAIESV